MIKINVLNIKDNDGMATTPEESAANDLKEIFTQQFAHYPQAKGELNIYSSLTLFGQKIKDIDLLLFGNFEGFKIRLDSLGFVQPEGVINQVDIDQLNVKSICCVIELKDHPSDKVMRKGEKYFVSYNSKHFGGEVFESLKNVSQQSEDQKYSLKNFLLSIEGFDIAPYICNFIWFRQILQTSLIDNKFENNSNILLGSFDFIALMKQAVRQQNVYRYDNCFHFGGSDTFYSDYVQVLRRKLLAFRKPAGLTRKKLELLAQDKLNKSLKLENINGKMTIFSGRAGTGKTVQLLQIAYKLADEEYANRCLLLTYNNALVSDIRRLIDFSGLPDSIDSRTVQIKTTEAFFCELMKQLGIDVQINNNDPQYFEKYTQGIIELAHYVNSALTNQDISYLKEINKTIDWDYVLIDEAQDWPDAEKLILYKIYGIEHIIVADGIDQFVRTNIKQNWIRGLAKEKVVQFGKMNLEMRQKENLVAFVNEFAKCCGVNWNVKKNTQLKGGSIIITSSLTAGMHDQLIEICKRNDCEAYDVLYLVPPSMVNTEGKRYFKAIDAFKQSGIDLFDGTNDQLRTSYSVSVTQSRVYQYESCRGLEGWCVVCANFDEAIAYKMNTIDTNDFANALDIEGEKRRRVYLWTLMALTRALDTMVITIKEPNSEVGRILKQFADIYPDFVDWNL